MAKFTSSVVDSQSPVRAYKSGAFVEFSGPVKRISRSKRLR